MTVFLVTNRLTGCESTPLLQLHDVPFRVTRINHTKQTNTFHFGLGNFSHCTAAGCDYCPHGLIDIVYRKCDVRESALIRFRQFAFDQLIVAKDLQRRPILTIPGQAQMNAAKMRIWNCVYFLEPLGTHIALRTLGFASEHLAIEPNKPFPISGNQIRMYVFSADW